LNNFTYRIYHLAKYYPPIAGGIETHVQSLARAQADLGAEVTVFCINGLDDKGYKSVITKTVEKTDHNVQVECFGRLLSFARFDLCPEIPGKIWQLVNQPNTIIHLHTPNPIMLMTLAATCSQVPLVVSHHSDVIKQRILKYGLRPFEHLIYRKATCILTSNPKYAEGSDILKNYTKQLQILPYGLHTSKYIQPNKVALAYAHSLKEKYGTTPIWLVVGRLVYYKAIHLAIEALSLVPGTLIVIGTGPLEKELKSKAQKLGLDNRIVWHGHASADELIGAYHAAMALWFPSNLRSESFGLVQVEAMASGCPVINADIPYSGVSWVSRHEKEGLTVPPNNSVALAKAAKRLIDDPVLRNRLANASRDRSREFDNIVMAQRSFEIYEQALHSYKAKHLARDSSEGVC